MIEKINVKVLAIVLVIAIVLGIGIFITVRTVIENTDKSYELERISKVDYKYFVVLTERKIWSNRWKRKYDSSE